MVAVPTSPRQRSRPPASRRSPWHGAPPTPTRTPSTPTSAAPATWTLFPDAAALAAALDPLCWEILVAGAITRPATGLDGEHVTATDTVLRARRR